MRFAKQSPRSSHRARLLLLVLALLAMLPASAIAQESPFGDTTFTSPKYGTEIEWTDNWNVAEENSSIEVRRDVLALIESNGDDAVLIELQSQRTYRTGEEFITAAMQTYSRLPGFEIVDDNTDQTPPSMSFLFDIEGFDEPGAGLIQSQPIAGATMVVIVLSLLETLDDVADQASDEITVNGVPLLEALPVCGNATPEADESGEEGSNSSGEKTGGFGGQDDGEDAGTESAATCVEIFQSSNTDPRPTPTPEDEEEGRGTSFTDRAWESPTFPGVTFSFDRTAWEVDEELDAESNNGRDGIVLFHVELPAYVVVEVYDGHNGRAGACIDSALAEASISPGSDEPISDADGNPINGSQQGRVWAAFAYELELDDGTENVGGYVECRALPGAAGVLVFTMISIIDSFEEAYDEIQPMIRSIRVGSR